jgi:hypothetical protein
MTPYRKDVEKFYNRIVKIVSKGESYLLRYFDIIDEIIGYGKSNVLQDVLLKFKIDTTTYNTLEDLKKNTFKKIAFYLQSTPNKNLDNLLINKNVYRLGTHFYDSSTHKYIGDIEETSTSTISNVLDIYTFIPSKLQIAIPQFLTSSQITLTYVTNSVIYYGINLYECDTQYTWSYTNRITPTYSSYWHQILPGTQSYTQILGPTLSVVEKYTNAIDLLRTYTYSVV